MNRNFLTAFCIVALVGLSCPIVAKMACPVDEYFNQELQLVTTEPSEPNTIPAFYVNIAPNGDITIPTNTSFTLRAYTPNQDVTYDWQYNNYLTNGEYVSYSSDNGSYSHNVRLSNSSYNGMQVRCVISDGVNTAISNIVTFYVNRSSGGDERKGVEEIENSEFIESDEPIKKEDIEESKTELSEDTEVTE